MVIQDAIIIPLFELAKINENRKNKSVNKFTKKMTINIVDLGSVK